MMLLEIKKVRKQIIEEIISRIYPLRYILDF